ncbi:MAG: DUF2513 domain-containing protein [Phycisphaerales bacterium]|nr:MAG: DUF2513 domain-containing protein [Phycisphaerales bacterium]
MRRDFGLIREILLRAEANEDGFAPREIPGWSRSEVQYHHRLMVCERLLEYPRYTDPRIATVMSRLRVPPRITWSGHDFLDAARDDTVWNEALRRVGGAAASVSFGVMTQILTTLVTKSMGISQE